MTDYYSLESVPKDEHPDLTLEGIEVSEIDPNYRYVKYIDRDGRGWYQTQVRIGNGEWVPLEYALFGNRLKERRRRGPA